MSRAIPEQPGIGSTISTPALRGNRIWHVIELTEIENPTMTEGCDTAPQTPRQRVAATAILGAELRPTRPPTFTNRLAWPLTQTRDRPDLTHALNPTVIGRAQDARCWTD